MNIHLIISANVYYFWINTKKTGFRLFWDRNKKGFKGGDSL